MANKEIYDLQELFKAVQLNAILEDGKTFVDCIPRIDLTTIEKAYEAEKDQPGFDLADFVYANFDMPPVVGAAYQSNTDLPVEENIRRLWDVLTRQPSNEKSSLINLPNTYIVPGGRFREIYYWDSYFTMLGLRQHQRVDLIENMVANFAFLIREFGHIPNGNRQYYTSRSQPPFFALMVQLLSEVKQRDDSYLQYQTELQKEYEFWQHGWDKLNDSDAYLRVVKMPGGEQLNRFYDTNPQPRQESFKEDVELAAKAGRPANEVYTHLRAGAESGWDFSTRWFKDGHDLTTICTTNIVPVDLNCLLYVLELTLAKTHGLAGNTAESKEFEKKASQRRATILKYCWNEEQHFFCDYQLAAQQTQQQITAAGLYPLFIQIATTEQASAVAAATRDKLLKPGGLVTTNEQSGQQWDAPNGWAPLQWIAFVAFSNYDQQALANDIAGRWLALNEKVFQETGKLMEKYNVEDLDKPAGGGEYPGQDGFGWTNGVYTALKHRLQ